MNDRIEKSIEIHAPIRRVWQALTDHREFGEWFRVALDGPFRVGETARGRITYPGYEHLLLEATVRELQPERLFAFTWHPHAVDPAVDYSAEPVTRVEFRLEPGAAGTRLQVSESGFDQIPAARRTQAFAMNQEGWEVQLQNIRQHLG